MTTDPIAAAIDHIRSITPADNPWTADDVSSFSPWEPDESDYAIATILNAVVSGQLINRASRDEMLAQVRRGEGFATAGAEASWISDSEAGVYDADSAHGESKTGYWVPRRVAQDEIARLTAEVERLTKGSICEVAATNPSVMEYMRHWEGRAEKAETERATLADALEAERAKVAAAYDAAACVTVDMGPRYDGRSVHYHIPERVKGAIRAITPADAQAALDKMLAAARLEGWWAGREAAARSCVLSGQDLAEGDWGSEGRDMAVMLEALIRAMPEPEEASYD